MNHRDLLKALKTGFELDWEGNNEGNYFRTIEGQSRGAGVFFDFSARNPAIVISESLASPSKESFEEPIPPLRTSNLI
ncbi:MAG: hypothetical protein F4X44_00880 [Gammaproteobacteria bacterium]|nr:hypothetical protein [Gammaproteobacteria bacterium]